MNTQDAFFFLHYLEGINSSPSAICSLTHPLTKALPGRWLDWGSVGGGRSKVDILSGDKRRRGGEREEGSWREKEEPGQVWHCLLFYCVYDLGAKSWS